MKLDFFFQQPTYLFRRILGMSLGIIASTVFSEALTNCAAVSIQPNRSSASPLRSGIVSVSTSKTVQLKTADGWIIVGDLYMPSKDAKGAVVLLHQRGGSARDWQTLSTALQQNGYIALAIDQRGAGRSIHGPGSTGDNAPWVTSVDIETAIASLPKSIPVGLVGASYGANNALIYAAHHIGKIQGLVLLSPGANYNGLDAITAAHENRSAVLIYHGKKDAIAGNGPEQINAISSALKHRLQILNSSAHGTELLEPQIIGDTVSFFLSTLKS